MAGETGEGGGSHSQPEKQPGQAAAAASMAEAEVEELPKAIVRRLVKEKLAQVAAGGAEVIVNKDAMSAFAESARIFIHYLSATSVPHPPLALFFHLSMDMDYEYRYSYWYSMTFTFLVMDFMFLFNL